MVYLRNYAKETSDTYIYLSRDIKGGHTTTCMHVLHTTIKICVFDIVQASFFGNKIPASHFVQIYLKLLFAR